MQNQGVPAGGGFSGVCLASTHARTLYTHVCNSFKSEVYLPVSKYRNITYFRAEGICIWDLLLGAVWSPGYKLFVYLAIYVHTHITIRYMDPFPVCRIEPGLLLRTTRPR